MGNGIVKQKPPIHIQVLQSPRTNHNAFLPYRRKVIIDTDCGGDDAVGIIAAASDPNVDVVMLTATWGNIDVDQGVENLCKILDVLGKDIVPDAPNTCI